jgi:hypothetical protein
MSKVGSGAFATSESTVAGEQTLTYSITRIVTVDPQVEVNQTSQKGTGILSTENDSAEGGENAEEAEENSTSLLLVNIVLMIVFTCIFAFLLYGEHKKRVKDAEREEAEEKAHEKAAKKTNGAQRKSTKG